MNKYEALMHDVGVYCSGQDNLKSLTFENISAILEGIKSYCGTNCDGAEFCKCPFLDTELEHCLLSELPQDWTI